MKEPFGAYKRLILWFVKDNIYLAKDGVIFFFLRQSLIM